MPITSQIIFILLTTVLPDVYPSPHSIDHKQESVQTHMSSDLYDHHGANWPGLCKTGNLQSLIDIDPNLTANVPKALPIVFINYNLFYLYPDIQSNHELGITSGGLRGFYRLESVHFHWNAEHTISSNRDPLELHYKSIYSGSDEAKNYDNGLAVLGILFKIGTEDRGVAKLIQALNTMSTNSSLVAEELLPEETNEYYRYAGSLTTPGCEESVIWTIFKMERTTYKKQSEWFKTVRLKCGNVLADNYRLIQKIKRQKVYHVSALFE